MILQLQNVYRTEQYNTKNKTAQKIQHETHRQNSNYIVRFQGGGEKY